MKIIYLDHAATTPIDSEVLSRMLPYFGSWYGNASSMHSSGRRAAQALAEARERVARVLNADAEEIIFTGSGTESDNLALNGRHIIISAIEHKAVLERAKYLEQRGSRISIAPVDHYGLISISQIISLIKEDTDLVSIMLGNNEIGTIEPIAELAQELKKKYPNVLLHTDACQAAGLLKLDTKALGVDLLTLNGSKIYGPKGIGVLYKKHGVKIAPLIVGGNQELGLRAGTESVALIMGMSLALEKTEKLREKESERLQELRERFIKELKAKIPGIQINGHPSRVLSHIVHVSVPGIEGESMVLMLDEHGIETATGSACSTHDLRPSHVLRAIGQDDDLMHGSLRFSLGRSTTREELDEVVGHFTQIVKTLRQASALTTTYYGKERHIV